MLDDVSMVWMNLVILYVMLLVVSSMIISKAVSRYRHIQKDKLRRSHGRFFYAQDLDKVGRHVLVDDHDWQGYDLSRSMNADHIFGYEVVYHGIAKIRIGKCIQDKAGTFYRKKTVRE